MAYGRVWGHTAPAVESGPASMTRRNGMRTIQMLGAVVGLFLFACGAAWPQAYPARPVRVVVVFPPGGATDITARIVFQKMGEQMKQQFVIDNRSGAAGMIGAEIVAKSPPDGYTLMVYSQTFLAN